VANPLYAPSNEGNFEKYPSGAGIFSSVRFSPKLRVERDMQLAGFRLDEYLEASWDTRTPSLPYSPTDLSDKLDTEFSAFSKLLEGKFIIQYKLGEAYDHIFPNDNFIQDKLSILGVADLPVFQVTPKGNTLVLLFELGGTKKPSQPYELGELKQA